MTKNQKIKVRDVEIGIAHLNQEDYISLTDIARHRDSERTDYILQNWMRSRSTIEFLGLWERLNNPAFNSIEFDGFKNQAGSNSFSLTPKRWIEATKAIGIISKAGRYGGTYAHRDIAFEFASWISVEFKLYLVVEFQQLKKKEEEQKQVRWNVSRTLAKVNYRIHTDAIKEKLIPEKLPKDRVQLVYASEADLLNVALFGQTAKEWRDQNPDTDGNIRDHSTIEQLVVLANLESINAMLIQQGMSQPERLRQLNALAIQQMKSLLQSPSNKNLLD